MSGRDKKEFEFVGEVGVEAWKHIGARVKELGPMPPTERIIAELGAVTICLANILRPAIEASSSRTRAADQLLERVMQQARVLLEPVIAEGRRPE
jgi:hypothetical protein